MESQKPVYNFCFCQNIRKHKTQQRVRCIRVYIRKQNKRSKRVWTAFGFVCPECFTIFTDSHQPIKQTKDYLKLRVGREIEDFDRERERVKHFEIYHLKTSCKHKWVSKFIQNDDLVSIRWKCGKCQRSLYCIRS